MKKTFTLLLCWVAALAGVGASAATTDYKSIVVNRTDGTLTRITIESGMTTSIAEGEFVLSCAKGEIYIPMEETRNWSFSTEPGDADQLWAGIAGVDADGSSIELIWAGNSLTVTGLAADSRVSLVGMDGRVMKSAVATGEITLDLGGYQKGVYVLTVNKQSFKIALTR